MIFNVVRKYVWNPIIYSAKPHFCHDILNRAQLENWPAPRMIYEAHSRFLPLSNGCILDDSVRKSLEMHQELRFPGQHLVCIPNAYTFGGLVKLSSGDFIAESPWRLKYFHELPASRTRYTRHKVSVDGDCYFINTLFSSNYAHWFADELPRMFSALPFLPATTRFLVSDSIQSFQSDSLATLGIGQDRIVIVKGYYETRCERLWYVTPTDDMVWNVKVLGQIATILLKAYGNVSGNNAERLFVSRSGLSKGKRLANEDDLLPTIEDYRFSIVRPESMSLAQQVKAFSNARVVLGPHGAGFTNLMFTPQAHLLELQDSHFAPRVWYWRWASALGCEYSSMSGPASDSKNWLDTSFSIHPDSLKQYLESSLSSESSKSGPQWWVSQ